MDRKALEHLAIDFQIKLYETAVSLGQDHTSLLAELADLYARAGFHEKGLAVDEALTRRDPTHAVFHYNLACTLTRLERFERAFEMLHRALDLGFDDIKLLLEDRDLAGLRSDARWGEVVKRVGGPTG